MEWFWSWFSKIEIWRGKSGNSQGIKPNRHSKMMCHPIETPRWFIHFYAFLYVLCTWSCLLSLWTFHSICIEMAPKITVFIVTAEQLFQVDVLYAPFRERCDLMSLKLNQNYTLVKQLMLIYVTVNERAPVWKRKREKETSTEKRRNEWRINLLFLTLQLLTLALYTTGRDGISVVYGVDVVWEPGICDKNHDSKY